MQKHTRSLSDQTQREKEPEASLKKSIIEGSAFSIMDAFTANFISPFALALQAGNTFISVIATLPALIAAFGQLLVTVLLRLYSRRKFWIVLSAVLQALTWIPIALIPKLSGSMSLPMLFILVTLNACFAAIINPLWTSLMGDLVPQDQRGSYFGRRNFIAGAVAFVSTLIAGFLLNALSQRLSVFVSFGILFSVAFASRIASSYYLSRMHEPPFHVCRKKEFSLVQFISRLRSSEYGVFVIYLCLLGFACNIATPFFSVYMLRDLHFNYWQFTILTSVSVISGFLTIIFWGNLSDRLGNKRIMLMTGLLVPFVPFLWLFFSDLKYLILIELFSGVVWAGFNLAASNYVYDATSPEKRPRCIVYLNVLRASCVFIGAFLGGSLANSLPNFWFFTSSIQAIFLISAVLRMTVTILFYTRLREARLVEVTLHHSGNVGSIIINPRQAMAYSHPMELHDETSCPAPTMHVKEDRKSPKKDNPMHVKDVGEQKRLLSQFFRLKNIPLRLEQARLNWSKNRQIDKNKPADKGSPTDKAKRR
jgi:MFS family permease